MTNLLTADGCTVYEFAHARMVKGDWDCWTTLRDEIVRQARAKWERELAEVKRQAAWDALTDVARASDAHFVTRFRDTHYAPTPRSVTLSDGTVVEMRLTSWPTGYIAIRGSGAIVADWRTLAQTGADFDALKTFAATVEAK